jgi:hypothetical protein
VPARLSIALLIAVSLNAPGRARAQDLPVPIDDVQSGLDTNMEGVPGLEPPAPQPMAATIAPQPPAANGRMFSGGGFAILGSVGASSGLAVSFNAGAALFSIGLDFQFDPRGLANGDSRSDDELAMRISLGFAFMAYNHAKLAFGPEIGLVSTLAPGAAFTSRSELHPGLALWYAPFDAPLLIGTALLLPITFQSGADPVLGSEYPGLRIRYGF